MAFRVRFLAFYCTLKKRHKKTQTLCLSGSEGEPALGFEPRTYGLQNRCTTTVLCRRGTERVEFCNAIFSLNQALIIKKLKKR